MGAEGMHTRFETGFACLVAAGLLAAGGCGSDDPLGPQAERIYIEVRVSGGIASVDYTYAVDGDESVVRGIVCNSGCDFEPGEVLAGLTPAQVLYFAELLADAGVILHDGVDFGVECCDQFHYAIDYRDGELESSVRGSTGALPNGLAGAVAELDLLLQGVLPIVIDWDSQPDDWPSDRLQLRDYSLEGSVLSVDVEYGGGCATHELDLVAWGGWLESFPVQVNVLLSHEDHDDACDALIHRTLKFNLIPLRGDYEASYGVSIPGETTIVVRLTVPDGGEVRTIEYTY
jgi:hypothetical protein